MRNFLNTTLVGLCAVGLAACSQQAEPEAGDTATEAEADTAEVETAAVSEASEQAEAYEVCDENGNRYPSEDDARAAGLSEAEYGATFCEYFE